VPVPVFYYFCISKKVTQEIFSELDETKAKLPIFPGTKTKSKAETEEGWPHQVVVRVTPGRATRWCGPLVHPLISPFRLYILFEAKTLKSPAFVHEKFCSAVTIENQFQGTEVSVSAPCRDRELPPEPSPSTPPSSLSTLLSLMMRRE
jgi:hypothetical protein